MSSFGASSGNPRYLTWVFDSLDSQDADAYAGRALRNLRGWLNDDPLIERDRERTALARELGPVTICARGMTLPRRKALCCAPAIPQEA